MINFFISQTKMKSFCLHPQDPKIRRTEFRNILTVQCFSPPEKFTFFSNFSEMWRDKKNGNHENIQDEKFSKLFFSAANEKLEKV